MRIAIIGAGYVGLVSAACFAEFGTDVVAVDADAAKVAALRAGQIPIYEPGLDRLVQDNAREGRLTFTTDIHEGVRDAEAVFLAVGTPSRRGDGHADLSFVFAAAEQVAMAATKPFVLVTKSTVPVGTAAQLKTLVKRVRPDLDIVLASNPEFLREGNAIGDFMRPDRVVIGADSDRAFAVLRRLYRPLFLIETPIVATSLETAELTKYAANAFLAAKVTFINEVADLCERVGANVHDVARGIGLDGRIGRKFLHPGPGYGGSCFPKDTLALARTAREANAPMSLVEATIASNDARKLAMVERVLNALQPSPRGKKVGVLGLAFKPETDDMRDAPSLTILPRLLDAGVTLSAFDPAAMANAATLLPPEIHYARNALDAVAGADLVLLLTEWNEFRAIAPAKLRDAMRGAVAVDLRNAWDPVAMQEAGFRYFSVGRP